MPKGVQPKVDLINRLVQEIATSHRHFSRSVKHWRDLPARQRLEGNRQQLAMLFELLAQQAPDQAAAIKQQVETTLAQEINRGV